MSKSSIYKSQDLSERIDCALDMLYAGIKKNDLGRVDTSLQALPSLMRDAIDTQQYPLLEKVNQGMKLVFSKHALLPGAVAGTVSLDILELILEQTTPTPTHYIWNAGISKMSSRMSALLAHNLTRFRGQDFEGLYQVLSQLYEPKHEEGFRYLYAHMINATLKLSNTEYSKMFCDDSQNIFGMIARNMDKEKATPWMSEEILKQQEEVLAHIAKQRLLRSDKKLSGFDYQVVVHLYKKGFDRLPVACGESLLNTNADLKQLSVAEKMGIEFSKGFVIDKLTGVSDSAIVDSALHYALQSKRFTVEDMVSVRDQIQGMGDALRKALERSLPVAFKSVVDDLFTKVSAGKNALLIEKAEIMVDWALKTEAGLPLDKLVHSLINLPHVPDSLINKRPVLRDAKFGRDLGF